MNPDPQGRLPEILYKSACALERTERRASGLMGRKRKDAQSLSVQLDPLRPSAMFTREAGSAWEAKSGRWAHGGEGGSPRGGHWNPRASTRSGHPKKQPQEGSKVT